MAAARILREEAPDWRIRVVNVIDILVLGIPQKYPGGLDEARFQRIFPLDCPVLFNFHGYTSAIKQLVWERPGNSRFDINGYREEGTTTTPFDMLVRNRVSRYHLVMKAAEEIAAREDRQADPGCRRPEDQQASEVARLRLVQPLAGGEARDQVLKKAHRPQKLHRPVRDRPA